MAVHLIDSCAMPTESGGQSGGLGALVRDHRIRAGMSQRALSERVDISVRALRDIEQGRVASPRRSTIQRLAAALDIDDRDRATLGPAPHPHDSGPLRVSVLGPLTVHHGARRIEIGSAGAHSLLGLLAVQASTAVPVDEIVEGLWGPRPPRTFPRLVRLYAAQVRDLLEPRRPAGSPARILRRTRTGYRLDLATDAVDLAEFDELVARAAATAPPADRLGLLARALEHWHGPVLADAAARLRSHPAVVAAGRRRVAAVLAYADLAIAHGRHDQAIGRLEAVADGESLNEAVFARLMLALAGCGQQAAALRLFDDIRARLRDELGVEPGPELYATHVRVLRQQVPTTGPAVRTGHPTPAQLPADVAAFTGRHAELERLGALLPGPGSTGTASGVIISALSGTAGVGKTALAVRWAHRARDRFPDGQLYVNLRGYDAGPPTDPADVLAAFLAALGVSGTEIPLAADERAARYRTEVSGRRMLILLDNASTAEQVRPLLPGSSSCAVLVTSRDSLAGLVAANGAHRIDLDLLPADDAVALLRRLIGSRVAAEPAATAALVDQCARLPLALRVAAELAAARSATPLADLVAELADQQRRLDRLDAGGDPRTAVAAVFSWSIRHLPPAAARAFALLGLHPGADADAYATAALCDTEVEEATRSLRRLAGAHLIHPTGPGRYGMHDLLRAYASGLARRDGEDARGALDRLFDHYLAAATAAMDTLHPAEARRRPAARPAGTPSPDLTDPADARHWLDAERATLVAVAGHAAAGGWPAHTVRLSAVLYRYLVGGHHAEALAVHRFARAAAHRTGDAAGEASAHNGLAAAHAQLGHPEVAADHLATALDLARRSGDLTVQARTLGNLGLLAERMGRYDRVVAYVEASLALYEQTDDRLGQACATDNLGSIAQRQGRFELAVGYHRRALALARQVGDRTAQSAMLSHLGDAHRALGRLGPAADHYRRALALHRQAGDRTGEAWTLDNLGSVLTRLGHPERATAYHQRALAHFRALGQRDGEAFVLNGLGEAAHALGRFADAITHHNTALLTATGNCDDLQRARAHAGLSHARHALCDHAGARDHGERALALYTELDAPEAADARAHLAALPA
jgi:DNA-binding SARP family transcriptional activator/tetratricopeptide (TPR) repeat protein/DNA-binding XRE family transcriptional regulator